MVLLTVILLHSLYYPPPHLSLLHLHSLLLTLLLLDLLILQFIY